MKLAYLLPWPICFFEQLVGSQEMPAAGVGGWGNRMSWGKEAWGWRSVLYTGDGAGVRSMLYTGDGGRAEIYAIHWGRGQGWEEHAAGALLQSWGWDQWIWRRGGRSKDLLLTFFLLWSEQPVDSKRNTFWSWRLGDGVILIPVPWSVFLILFQSNFNISLIQN